MRFTLRQRFILSGAVATSLFVGATAAAASIFNSAMKDAISAFGLFGGVLAVVGFLLTLKFTANDGWPPLEAAPIPLTTLLANRGAEMGGTAAGAGGAVVVGFLGKFPNGLTLVLAGSCMMFGFVIGAALGERPIVCHSCARRVKRAQIPAGACPGCSGTRFTVSGTESLGPVAPGSRVVRFRAHRFVTDGAAIAALPSTVGDDDVARALAVGY